LVVTVQAWSKQALDERWPASHPSKTYAAPTHLVLHRSHLDDEIHQGCGAHPNLELLPAKMKIIDNHPSKICLILSFLLQRNSISS